MSIGLFGRLQQEVEARAKTPGLSMADILALPDSLRRLINWMIREGEVGLTDVVAHIGQDETAARSLLADLTERGFVRETGRRGEARFRVRLAPRRRLEIPLNIWQALEEKTEE